MKNLKKNISQGIFIKQKAGSKLDVVDMKGKRKLTQAKFPKVWYEWKTKP